MKSIPPGDRAEIEIYDNGITTYGQAIVTAKRPNAEAIDCRWLFERADAKEGHI